MNPDWPTVITAPIDLRKKCILILEDNQTNIQLMKAILDACGYINVIYAFRVTPDTLARTMKDQPPDLIILDWVMPGMSGADVLKWLKEGAYTVPVLVVTADMMPVTITAALEGGADMVLTKPVEIEVVAKAICDLLSS